jgi:hypothetical protein
MNYSLGEGESSPTLQSAQMDPARPAISLASETWLSIRLDGVAPRYPLLPLYQEVGIWCFQFGSNLFPSERKTIESHPNPALDNSLSARGTVAGTAPYVVSTLRQI